MDSSVRDERTNERRQPYQQEALLELTTNDDVRVGNFAAAVRTITETAAAVLEVSSVNVWLFDDDGTRVRCVDDYDSRTGEHASGAELDVTDYPTYVDALRTHRTIDATDAYADLRTAELEPYLTDNDVGALLDATLRSEGEIVGVVCHEHAGSPRAWTDEEIQFAGAVADIVHRALRNHQTREYRKQLAYRRSLLKAQQEAIPDGVVVTDGDGEILSYNDRFCELWQLPRELLEGGTQDRLFSHLRSKLRNGDAFVRRAASLRDDPDAIRSEELHLADGRVFEWYTSPVGDARETYYGRLWLVRDVTIREEAIRQLKVFHRILRHNISNQMTIVRGAAERVASEPTADVPAAGALIVEEIDRLTRLIEKHRKIVQLVSERPDVEPIEIDTTLKRVVDEVGEGFPDARLRIARSDDPVVAAVPMIERALRELLTNAILYDDRDTPSVEIAVESDDDAVRILIADEGPGLPTEEAAILRGEQDVEPLYHGSGTGLWLVYWIVLLSRGTICVEDNEPRGTIVRIELRRLGDRRR